MKLWFCSVPLWIWHKNGPAQGFYVEIAVMQEVCQSSLFLVRLQEIQRFLVVICEDQVRWAEHRKEMEKKLESKGRKSKIRNVKSSKKKKWFSHHLRQLTLWYICNVHGENAKRTSGNSPVVRRNCYLWSLWNVRQDLFYIRRKSLKQFCFNLQNCKM